LNREEREYLDLVHRTHEKHGIQTKIFSVQPLAVKFDLFHGHCELCQKRLQSRPMYIVKMPNLEHYQIKYWCTYCAGIHERYIISLIITKN